MAGCELLLFDSDPIKSCNWISDELSSVVASLAAYYLWYLIWFRSVIVCSILCPYLQLCSIRTVPLWRSFTRSLLLYLIASCAKYLSAAHWWSILCWSCPLFLLFKILVFSSIFSTASVICLSWKSLCIFTHIILLYRILPHILRIFDSILLVDDDQFSFPAYLNLRDPENIPYIGFNAAGRSLLPTICRCLF